MALIYESENFIIESAEKPHITRSDGGHINIRPKTSVVNRQELSPRQAIELMRLTILAGRAMKSVMNEHGVDIGRINYQDNGNWNVLKPSGPHMSIHLYGRAKSARVQEYGEACYFPNREDNPEFYNNLQPLTEEDVRGIREMIKELLRKEKFSDSKPPLS